ncbi:MAG: hypothetical protein PHV82_04495, partial [Victivallaceae bacterium]|nr:hypothetical protein [Victivallaceae bacterium]
FVAPEAMDHLPLNPDMTREAMWLSLSRRPDMVGFFAYEIIAKTKTYDELKKLSEELLQPIGPMWKKLDRHKREVAFLVSFASQQFGRTPRAWGWRNRNHLPAYTMLQMAHIPADIIFEETIDAGCLKDYKTLVLIQCDVLPRSVYEQIAAFAKRGGTVIGDSYIKADIPGMKRIDYDFSDLYTIKSYYSTPENERITGAQAEEILLNGSNKFKEAFKGKVDLFADCDSPKVLLNVLEKSGVKYIIAVNDKRKYGDWIGKYKAVQEEGVAQDVKIRIKKGNYHLYDVMKHEEIKYTVNGDFICFDLHLEPCAGAIIAVQPQETETVKVSYSPDSKPSTVKIQITDAEGNPVKGAQPIKVDIYDSQGNRNEFSDYYAAEDGKFVLNFQPAINEPLGLWKIKVMDLTSGKSGETGFYNRKQ